MQADFLLDYDVVTVEQPHRLYLMARLMAGPALKTSQRRPLNLGLVIDRSGSMTGDKLAFTRHAAQFLVQNLGADDLLSIVLYNDVIEVLMPPEPVAHKDLINQRIAAIKASGTTNLSGGWLEGCKLVRAGWREDRLNRVILMSDGLANRGITDHSRLVSLARQKFNEGVSTTTMGLGNDFNEDLLMAMADAGGGAFYFIESPEVTPQIFQEELSGLLNVVGQNLVVTLQLTPQVASVQQLNAYPTERLKDGVVFRLGDIFGEEIKTLVLELGVPALREVGERQIAVLRFEYDEITLAGTQHRVIELPVRINVAQAGALPPTVNASVRRSVLLLLAAQARREAIRSADAGEFKEASQFLRSAADMIAQSSLTGEDLDEERESLLRQANDLEHGAAAYTGYSRKSMLTQAFYTTHDRHQGSQMLRTREVSRIMKPVTGERRAGMAPTFVLWNRRAFPLEKELIRIGRASQNDIVIDRRSVSRFHCQIRRDGDRLLLEDLSSTNGTYVNDARLDGFHALSVGDSVRIGDEYLVFSDTDADD